MKTLWHILAAFFSVAFVCFQYSEASLDLQVQCGVLLLMSCVNVAKYEIMDHISENRS